MKIINNKLLFFSLLIFFLFALGACSKNDASRSSREDRSLKAGSPEYVMAEAGCVTCHSFTKEEEKAYPGKIPLGETALTEAQFFKAVTEGIAPTGDKIGETLMPWKYYAKARKDDISKLYEYYMAVSFPGDKMARAKNLPTGEEFKDDGTKSKEYNRGAYLVQTLGHCGFCHSEAKGEELAGGRYKMRWIAYNITSDPIAGIGGWKDGELEKYFKNGVVPTKGNSISGMGLVVEDTTSLLTDGDRKAIADYLKGTKPYNNGMKKAAFDWGEPYENTEEIRTGRIRLDKPGRKSGAALYNGYCASCHGYTGEGIDKDVVGGFPSLASNTTVGADTVNNLAMIVLHGSSRMAEGKPAFMPAIGSELTDEEAAAVINFVTKNFGNPKVSIAPAEVGKMR